MKITQVYSILKEGLGGWLKTEGFRRSKQHGLGYERPFTNKLLVLWFQADRWGWDAYRGGGFRYLIATFPDGNPTHDYEQAFQYFLTEDELEGARGIQNSVIAALPIPPKSYFSAVASTFRGEMGTQIIAEMRSQFLPVTVPYRWNHDFFLRYFSDAHVRQWCDFLAPILARAIQRAEQGWMRDSE